MDRCVQRADGETQQSWIAPLCQSLALLSNEVKDHDQIKGCALTNLLLRKTRKVTILGAGAHMLQRLLEDTAHLTASEHFFLLKCNRCMTSNGAECQPREQ